LASVAQKFFRGSRNGLNLDGDVLHRNRRRRSQGDDGAGRPHRGRQDRFNRTL